MAYYPIAARKVVDGYIYPTFGRMLPPSSAPKARTVKEPIAVVEPVATPPEKAHIDISSPEHIRAMIDTLRTLGFTVSYDTD